MSLGLAWWLRLGQFNNNKSNYPILSRTQPAWPSPTWSMVLLQPPLAAKIGLFHCPGRSQRASPHRKFNPTARNPTLTARSRRGRALPVHGPARQPPLAAVLQRRLARRRGRRALREALRQGALTAGRLAACAAAALKPPAPGCCPTRMMDECLRHKRSQTNVAFGLLGTSVGGAHVQPSACLACSMSKQARRMPRPLPLLTMTPQQLALPHITLRPHAIAHAALLLTHLQCGLAHHVVCARPPVTSWPWVPAVMPKNDLCHTKPDFRRGPVCWPWEHQPPCVEQTQLCRAAEAPCRPSAPTCETRERHVAAPPGLKGVAPFCPRSTCACPQL